MISLSVDKEIECGKQGACIFTGETIIEFLVVSKDDRSSKKIFVLDGNFVLTKLLEVSNAGLMIVDCGVELQVREWSSSIDYDTRTTLVSRNRDEVPSCSGEDGIQKWWTSTGALRHNKSERPFWIADIKLEPLAKTSTGVYNPYPWSELFDEIAH